jgi:hypothetical protein
MKINNEYLYKATIVARREGYSIHRPCFLLAKDFKQAAGMLQGYCDKEKELTNLNWNWMALRVVNVPMLSWQPESFGAYKTASMLGYIVDTPLNDEEE